MGDISDHQLFYINKYPNLRGEGDKGRTGERENGRRGEGEKGRRGEGDKGTRGQGEDRRRDHTLYASVLTLASLDQSSFMNECAK